MLDKSCVPLLKVSSQDCGMHLIVKKELNSTFFKSQAIFFFKAMGMGKQARPFQGVLPRFLYSFQRPSGNSTVNCDSLHIRKPF